MVDIESSETAETRPAKARRLSPMMLAPALIFLVLGGVFFFALQTGDPSKLPSALIGKKVPVFTLPGVPDLVAGAKPVPGFSNTDLEKGKASIINVWASWCIPCHKEHPFLVELAERSGAPLFGINYKDKPTNARRFLGRYGNPFVAVGADRAGRAAIDWGVYGVPETFIVDGQGRIVYKHVGPIDSRIIEATLLPEIERARSRRSVAR